MIADDQQLSFLGDLCDYVLVNILTSLPLRVVVQLKWACIKMSVDAHFNLPVAICVSVPAGGFSTLLVLWTGSTALPCISSGHIFMSR